MDLDLSADIDEILNGEAGDDAVLETADPAETKNIRVIFHHEYSADTDFDTGYEAYDVWVECKTTDVENAAQNDTITISGTDYNVESVETQLSGWKILRLTEKQV